MSGKADRSVRTDVGTVRTAVSTAGDVGGQVSALTAPVSAVTEGRGLQSRVAAVSVTCDTVQ